MTTWPQVSGQQIHVEVDRIPLMLVAVTTARSGALADARLVPTRNRPRYHRPPPHSWLTESRRPYTDGSGSRKVVIDAWTE